LSKTAQLWSVASRPFSGNARQVNWLPLNGPASLQHGEVGLIDVAVVVEVGVEARRVSLRNGRAGRASLKVGEVVRVDIPVALKIRGD
jgi:hypothetical protein